MAGVLEGVDRRTRLVGQNRLELLLFRLGDRQRFGINVFKVQEVIQCPAMTQIPHSSQVVRGVANMRGRTISIIDLALATGRSTPIDPKHGYVIVTEYNRSVQGFLVSGVERIVNMNWTDILPPPKGAGNNYLTAVTRVDGELVEIVDVEKVLSEVVKVNGTVTPEVIKDGLSGGAPLQVLVADDSSVARNQIKRTLDQVGIESVVVNNGREALERLKAWADEGHPVSERLGLVISDVEMPEMDGYTLTTEIRADPRLQDLYVILHTSLSGVFNSALVEKVGANEFIPKFHPDDLAKSVIKQLKLKTRC